MFLLLKALVLVVGVYQLKVCFGEVIVFKLNINSLHVLFASLATCCVSYMDSIESLKDCR